MPNNLEVILLKNKNRTPDRTLLVSADAPLYFLIEIKHPESPANALAYRILETIKERCKEGADSPVENFENALKEINEILEKQTAENQTEWQGNLSAVIVLIDKDTLNVSSIGKCSCFLLREKNVTAICSSEEATNDLSFSNILSGEIQEKDKIILGNQDFFEKVPLNLLRETLIHSSFSEAGKKMAFSLQKEARKTSSGMMLEIKSPDSSTSPQKFTYYIDEAKTQKIVDSSFAKIRASHQTLKSLSNKLPKIPINFSFWKKHRRIIYVILAAIVGLILSYFIFATIKKKYEVSTQDQRKVLMQAEDKKRAGDEALVAGNKKEAENLYKEAINIANTINLKESKNLIEKINAEIDRINAVTRVSAKEMLDLSFLKEHNVPQIFIVDKSLYFVDKKSRQIYLGKEPKTSLSQSAGDFNFGTYQPQENLLVLYQESEGIFEYNIDENKIDKAKIVFEGKWKKGNAISSYFTNLYILKGDENQIYKHEKTAAGYSKAMPYLKKDKADFENIISIALDGYLYALKGDGTILKLMAGQPVTDFSLKNIPETDNVVQNPRKIITSVDASKIYILSENKIIALEKNGQYNKTYIADGIGDVKDFIVSQKNKKIYLLTQDKVYEFEL